MTLPTENPATLTLRDAIALQFATRPTLRQVLDAKLFQALVERYPQLPTYFPEIDSVAGFSVAFIRDDKIELQGLGSVLLDGLVQGRATAFTESQYLSTGAPAKGLDEVVEHSGLQALNMRLSEMNAVFDDILASLIEAFQRAQLDYWNAEARPNPDEHGVGRHRWMQQALRMTLADSVKRARLEDDERSYLNEVLLGRTGIEVSALTFSWDADDSEQVFMPGDLLIEAERDERKLILWCTPAGAISVFGDLAALSAALHESLARGCRFDKLTWRRCALDGDVFMQQSGMLLNLLLEDIEGVQLSALADGAELEAVMGMLSDPSRLFLNEDRSAPIGAAAALPEWLLTASSRDRFEYQQALLDASIEQALSKGQSSLGDLEDLHAYAARRLREQLLADYPVEANYFPDDLILSVSIPDPSVDPELPVTLKDAGSMTLTELAIGHLDALSGGVVSGIRHRQEQEIMDWMNPVYITRLIEQVDIGGTYPQHAAEVLNEPSTLLLRAQLFGREWRSGLLFDALKAKVEGQLSESAWSALAEFCRSARDLKENVDIAPLAFQAQSDRPQLDTVACMYAIVLKQPSVVLLYRPLYAQRTLLQFNDQAGLMAAVSQPGELQDSVLAWLPEDARAIYANGGFLEPHLHRPIFDTSILPGRVEPPRLRLNPYLADIDVRMFASKRAAVVELADRQSVSNAEHRWAVLKQFGWLCFDLAAPVLPGLLGRVAALVGLLSPFLERTSDAERGVSDTLLGANVAVAVAMALLHERQPEVAAPSRVLHGESVYRAIPRGDLATLPLTQAEFALSQTIGSLYEQVGPVSQGHGWGQGPAAQSKTLEPYVANVDLTNAIRANGLARVGDRFYVVIGGKSYQVLHDDHGRRIVGPHGEPGPLLVDDGVWRVRADGFLFGGSGRRVRGAPQGQFDRVLSDCYAQIKDLQARHPVTQGLQLKIQQLTTELDRLAALLDRFSQLPDEKAEQRAQLVADVQGRIAGKQAEYREATLNYVKALRELIDQNKQLITRLDSAIELKTRHPALVSRHSKEMLAALRLDSCVEIVRYGNNIIARLATIADSPELLRLEKAIHGHRISEVRDLYMEYKRHLPLAAEFSQQMVEASAVLDEYIVQVPENHVMVPAAEGNGQAVTLGDWIANRTITTQDMIFELAAYHMELSLGLEQEGAYETLLGYRERLMSPALSVASNAHAQLPLSNLSAADRIEVLQVAWDEYSTAIINAIDIKREGGAFVDLAMLEAFERDMKALKQSANAMLIDATRALESRVPLAPQRRPYPIEQSQQRVVYGRDGQIAIGREVDVDGVPVVEVAGRTFEHAVLKRFDLVEGVWIERVPVPVVPDGARAELVKQALDELALDKPLEQRLEALTRQGLNIRDLKNTVDDHIDRLERLAGALAEEGGFSHKKLVEVLGSWPQRRQDLLVKAYANTPYPEADGLLYLHEQKRLLIKSKGNRQLLKDGSAMDEYSIQLRGAPGGKPGKIIWAAHFHFATHDALPAAFTAGHLKTWEQRFMGWQDAQALAERGERLHRGRLTQAQAVFAELWNSPA